MQKEHQQRKNSGDEIPMATDSTSVFWNDFDIKIPPLVTVATSDMNFVSQLQNVVQPAIKKWLNLYNGKRAQFDHTATLLSRLIARRKNSFRRMVGFRALCKLNAALCRLLRVDLEREMERFDGTLPDGKYVGVKLPSHNWSEYLLTRILAVYHIHARIRDLCKIAAEQFVRILRSNHFMEISALILGVVAKLYNFSRIMGNECVALYNNLRRHKDRFPRISKQDFLPADVLPLKLEEFNDAPVEKEKNTIEEITLAPTPQPIAITRIPKHVRRQQDIGVKIERKVKDTNKTTLFSLEQLETVEDVSNFFKMETKQRQHSLQMCVSKNVQQHEWLGLQKMFQRKLDAKDPKKAVAIVRKFLGNKI